jgi:hypothetical protein
MLAELVPPQSFLEAINVKRHLPTASISDVVLECANCHVIIHRGGKCRPLAGVIGE